MPADLVSMTAFTGRYLRARSSTVEQDAFSVDCDALGLHCCNVGTVFCHEIRQSLARHIFPDNSVQPTVALVSCLVRDERDSRDTRAKNAAITVELDTVSVVSATFIRYTVHPFLRDITKFECSFPQVCIRR